MFNLVPFRFDELERNLWPDIWNDEFFTRRPAGFKTDISETEKEYLIEAELPGYAKEEINVEVDEDRLTITATKDETNTEEKANYIRRERRTGQVTRSFILENVDRDAINAEFLDGILKLALPKKEAEVPKARKIDIN